MPMVVGHLREIPTSLSFQKKGLIHLSEGPIKQPGSRLTRQATRERSLVTIHEPLLDKVHVLRVSPFRWLLQQAGDSCRRVIYIIN